MSFHPEMEYAPARWHRSERTLAEKGEPFKYTPENQATEPRAVPGPASIPAIRSAVAHHAKPAAASSAATIPSSVRIAVNGG